MILVKEIFLRKKKILSLKLDKDEANDYKEIKEKGHTRKYQKERKG